MEFATLMAKVKKVSTPQFVHLFGRKMKEMLQGGVHALFDFRENGIDVLLQVRGKDGHEGCEC